MCQCRNGTCQCLWPKSGQSMIRAGLKALFEKGDTIEVRALCPPAMPFTGRFKYGTALLRALEWFDQNMEYDLYYCLNPSLLPVTSVMMQYQVGTKKEDVAFRRWFLLDGDPVRQDPNRKIATEQEWQGAVDVMTRAKGWLESRGWSGIVQASSGNGCHLLVPCCLPNDKEAEHLVKSVQRAVSDKFSTPEVLIECFPDSDRITRAYGTLNRRRKKTDTLPSRRSGLL